MNTVNSIGSSFVDFSQIIRKVWPQDSDENRDPKKKNDDRISATTKVKWLPEDMLKMMHTSLSGSEKVGYNQAVVLSRIRTVSKPSWRRRVDMFAELYGYSSYIEYMELRPRAERIEETTLMKLRQTQLHLPRSEGRKALLSDDQEIALAAMLYYLSLEGNSIDHNIVRKLLIKVAPDWGLNERFVKKDRPGVSKGWIQPFLKRHPYIKLRDGKTLDATRKAGESTILPWFRKVAERVAGISPSLIGNLDETMCSNSDRHVKVIGATMAAVANKCGTETENPHVSLLPLVVADGTHISSMVIMSNKSRANPDTIPHVPDETTTGAEDKSKLGRYVYAATETGFIEEECYYNYIKYTVIPGINLHRQARGVADQQFILLLDGHISHHSLRAIKELSRNNIVCLFLPPHTSHLIQPLDRGVFHTLKRALAAALLEAHTIGGKPNIARRVELIKEAWKEKVTTDFIKKSFYHACISPFDVRRVENTIAMGFSSNDTVHAPAATILKDQATAMLIWGPGAVDILEKEKEAIENNGVVVRTTTNLILKKDGSPSKRTTLTSTMYIGSGVIKELAGIKRVIGDMAGEEGVKRRKPNKVQAAGGFSDAPDFLEQHVAGETRALLATAKVQPLRDAVVYLKQTVPFAGFAAELQAPIEAGKKRMLAEELRKRIRELIKTPDELKTFKNALDLESEE